MTRKLPLLALVLSFSACTPQWVEFIPPDGAFKLLMPVKPTMKPSHAGTMYVAVVGDVTYNVGITSVPEAFKDPSTAEKMFDEMQKSLIGSEAPPRGARQVSLQFGADTFPGREVTIERKNATGLVVVIGRVYRVRSALYTLTIYAPASEAGSPDVQKFSESFTLLKVPTV